jgi:hypothetical protein
MNVRNDRARFLLWMALPGHILPARQLAPGTGGHGFEVNPGAPRPSSKDKISEPELAIDEAADLYRELCAAAARFPWEFAFEVRA